MGINALSPLMILFADEACQLPVEQLALALGESEPHILNGVADGITALNSRVTPPSYLVIDIGNRSADVLAELDQLAEHCDAETRVVVAGSVNDVGFYRALKNRGILEYFPYPAQISAMRDTLRSSALIKSTGSINSAEGGLAVSFMSAASGDGASTVALNTAYCLAEVFNRRTVIVDFDYQFGMIAKQLDVQAPFGIRELFEYPDRGVDATLIEKMLFSYGNRLKVIAAPEELRRLPNVRPELIRDMVSVLKNQFEFVIFDIPHIWSDWTSAVLAQSDRNMLVAQLWLRSLTHMTRLLAGWREIGIPKEHLSLIINRSGAKFKEAITPQNCERISGKTIDFTLANDIKTIATAENQGKTVFEIESSLLERQIREIAAFLMSTKDGTQHIPTPPLEVEEEKAARFSWRSKKAK